MRSAFSEPMHKNGAVTTEISLAQKDVDMESGMSSGIGSGLGILIGALAFGVLYDRVVGYLEGSGRAQGYTAIEVIGGVLVSLALAGLFIGLEAFLITLLVFALTGTPVAIGSFWRHTEARKRQDEGTRAALTEGLSGGWGMGELMEEIRAMQRERGHDGP